MNRYSTSLHYDTLIIGGSLSALEEAHRTGLPLLMIPQPPPSIFFSEVERWQHLSFVLSLSGQLPMSDNVSKIRFEEDEKIISCFTNNSKIIRVSYEDAYIVEDYQVSGLPPPVTQPKKEFLVLDWISVRRGGNHPYDYILDEDSDFVKKIVFYPSRRIMGKRSTVKDACAMSIMTERQLRDLDYSETYVFLKARDMMKNAGLKGAKNGTQAYNGKPAYLSIKIEVADREVFPIHRNVYENTDSLHFNFELYDPPQLGYNDRIEHFLESINGRREPRGR